jgi:hypothetical protein
MSYKRISAIDAEKVFGKRPNKKYRREMQGRSSMGFLTKTIEERYWKGLWWDT